MSFTLRGSSSALLFPPPCKPSRTHPPRSAADRAALLYLRPCKPSRTHPSQFRAIRGLRSRILRSCPSHLIHARAPATPERLPSLPSGCLEVSRPRPSLPSPSATRFASRAKSIGRAVRMGAALVQSCAAHPEATERKTLRFAIKHNCLNCVAQGERSRRASPSSFLPPFASTMTVMSR